MSGPIRQLTAGPGAEPVRLMSAPGREFQELWFALARRSWQSLVLVPADAGGSASAFATSLAEVGRQLREAPVSFFIVADPLDYPAAAQLAASMASPERSDSAGAIAPAGKIIVAIQPVVVEPLGVAVTRAADAVVLCIELGRTRLADARRTIELIGRERIAGCLLIS